MGSIHSIMLSPVSNVDRGSLPVLIVAHNEKCVYIFEALEQVSFSNLYSIVSSSILSVLVSCSWYKREW